MKHLVLFSLFTVSFTSRSMHNNALITTHKTIPRKIFKAADAKFALNCAEIKKNKPHWDKQFMAPCAIDSAQYKKYALMRFPSDTGNGNAHDSADLYFAQVFYYIDKHDQRLDEDGLEELIRRVREMRQLWVTDQEKKEVEEMVVKKLKEDGLWKDLLLWGQNEARPKKRFEIR